MAEKQLVWYEEITSPSPYVYDFLLSVYSNNVSILHCFQDIITFTVYMTICDTGYPITGTCQKKNWTNLSLLWLLYKLCTMFGRLRECGDGTLYTYTFWGLYSAGRPLYFLFHCQMSIISFNSCCTVVATPVLPHAHTHACGKYRKLPKAAETYRKPPKATESSGKYRKLPKASV